MTRRDREVRAQMQQVFRSEVVSETVEEIPGAWYYLKKGDPKYEPLAPIIVLLPDFHTIQKYRQNGWIVRPVVVHGQVQEDTQNGD